MRSADGLGVGEGFAAQVGWETRREVLEGAELGADVDGGSTGGRTGRVLLVVIQDDGENGLRAAGVLNRLRGEEEAFFLGGGGVVGPVEGRGGVTLGAGHPFEEENDAVDGAAFSSATCSCFFNV